MSYKKDMIKLEQKDDSSFAIYKEFAHDGSKFRTIEEGLLAKKEKFMQLN